MTEPQLSIAFQTDKPLSRYGELASRAENYGFAGISVYNDMLYQPAWLPLLEIARHTNRATLSVAAVNPFTCHPVNIAGNIALLDEASGGRACLGLARGGWLDFVGVQPHKPVQALREAFICIRHLLRGDTQPLVQEIYPVAGGDTFRWQLLRREIPMLLGSWGLRTIENCHTLVDEVKLGGSVNPAIVPHYRGLMTAMGASPDTGIVMGAVTVVDEDGDRARALAKREVALYLPVVAELDTTLALDPQLMQQINHAAQRYDFEAASAFISDEMLTAFALAGTPAEVVAQTQALFDAGASRVEFGTPHGSTDDEGLRLLGEQVLPAFR